MQFEGHNLFNDTDNQLVMDLFILKAMVDWNKELSI